MLLKFCSTCVYYQTQQGLGTVPKSANPDRLRANIDIFDFRLSDADVDTITAFDLGVEGRYGCLS